MLLCFRTVLGLAGTARVHLTVHELRTKARSCVHVVFSAAQNLCILMLFWRYRLPRDCLAAASKEKSETARQASKEQGGVLPLSRFSTFSSRERLLSKTVLLLHFTLLAYARLAGEKQTTVFARTLATVLGVAPFPLRKRFLCYDLTWADNCAHVVENLARIRWRSATGRVGTRVLVYG